MTPGPGAREHATTERNPPSVASEPAVSVFLPLNEEEQRIIAVLQTQQEGMTVRQLQARLSWPSGGVQQSLENLLQCHLVCRLNTIVPSYVYRYRGVDLQAD